MSYRPKLIATDLDGTICPHAAPISKRTIAALTSAHELGVKIFFVTGRPPRWMSQIKEAFSFGQAICSNGGQLWDLQGEKVLEECRGGVLFIDEAYSLGNAEGKDGRDSFSKECISHVLLYCPCL